MKITYIALLVLFCLYASLTKAQQHSIPSGGTIISQVSVEKQPIVKGGEYGDISLTDVKGQPFKKAFIATTLLQPKLPEGFRIEIPNEKAIEQGDVLLLTFFAKTDVSAQITGEGTVTCTFEQTTAPYDKSLIYEIRINKTWQQYYIPFVVPYEYKPNQAQISFHLGYPQQIMQLADIKLIDYNKKLTVKDLPVNKVSYSGRELEAAWRKEAHERIEKYRKGDIDITVVDKKGNPLQGAKVELTQIRQLFHFGTHTDAKALMDNKTYQKKTLALFNEVSLEGDLSQPKWQNETNQQKTIAAFETVSKNNMWVNGHALLWMSSGFYPEWLQNLQGKPQFGKEEVTARLSESPTNLIGQAITEKAALLKNKFAYWELVNDLYDNPAGTALTENNALAAYSRMIKTEDPKTALFISTYGLLDNGGTDEERQLHAYTTLRRTIKNGADIDGISIPCHFKHNPTAPQVLIKLLDQYATLEKPIRITEFDIANRDEKLQADYTRDFYTAVFSHPAVSGISLWGFWEGQHPRPTGAMYRQDWTAKPSAQVWEELVHKQWKTYADGKTDKQGRYILRGFLGDYTYEVKANGKTLKGILRVLSNTDPTKLTIEVQ